MRRRNKEQRVNYHLFLLPPFKGEIKAALSFLHSPSILPPFHTPRPSPAPIRPRLLICSPYSSLIGNLHIHHLYSVLMENWIMLMHMHSGTRQQHRLPTPYSTAKYWVGGIHTVFFSTARTLCYYLVHLSRSFTLQTVNNLGLSSSWVHSSYKSWSNTHENPLFPHSPTHPLSHKSLFRFLRPCRPTLFIQRPLPSVSKTSLFCLKQTSPHFEEQSDCL